MQVTIQSIPASLQEFETLAAGAVFRNTRRYPLRQAEDSRSASAPCFCAHWHCLTRTGTPELPQ